MRESSGAVWKPLRLRIGVHPSVSLEALLVLAENFRDNIHNCIAICCFQTDRENRIGAARLWLYNGGDFDIPLFASQMRTVQEILGHAGLRMTQRYMHVTEAHKRQAVERLVGLQVKPAG